jgi:hypothetical protein
VEVAAVVVLFDEDSVPANITLDLSEVGVVKGLGLRRGNGKGRGALTC